MAIANNYIGLQRQIADECGDNQALLSPLSDSALMQSPIQIAIQGAIAKWEREPFYFNDFRLEPLSGGPFNTVRSQEFYSTADYAPLASLAAIKTLRVLISGNRYRLTPRDSGYLDGVSVNPLVTGQPTEYSYDSGQLRLYPIPDGAYPIGIVGVQRLSALVNNTDANAWTEDGFDLIRCEAKLILAREVLYDAEMEAASKRAIYGMDPQERGYLYALKAESQRRDANRSRVRPSYF